MAFVLLLAAAPVAYDHYKNRSSHPPQMQSSADVSQPPMSAPASVTLDTLVVSEPAQPFPESGSTQWYRPTDPHQTVGILRVMDTSDLPGNKVVRIRDGFGTPVAQTYIRFEEGAQLVLPIGHYDMTISTGAEWHGPQRQFGPGASYFRSGNGVDVINGEVNYRILPTGQNGQPLARIDAPSF